MTLPEATTPEFLKSVTWFWTSRHRWPSISRSHSRATDSFREIGLSLLQSKIRLEQKSSPEKQGVDVWATTPNVNCHVIICKSRDKWTNIGRGRFQATSIPEVWRYRKRPRPIFVPKFARSDKDTVVQTIPVACVIFANRLICRTGDRDKLAREWDRDILGQRCLLVQNHVTDFKNSGVVASGMTSFPVVLVAWQRDRDILVQRHEFAYNHVTKLT